MIDYEATIKEMDLRYAELYAELKETEFRLYKAYSDLRELRERPAVCVVENIKLRRLLLEKDVERAAAGDRRLENLQHQYAALESVKDIWYQRAMYAGRLIWKLVLYSRGKLSYKDLPRWVQKEVCSWINDYWVGDTSYGMRR